MSRADANSEKLKLYKKMLHAVKRLPDNSLWIDMERRRELVLKEVVKMDPHTYEISTQHFELRGSGNLVLLHELSKDPLEYRAMTQPKVELSPGSPLTNLAMVYVTRYSEEGVMQGTSLLGGFPKVTTREERDQLSDSQVPWPQKQVIKNACADVEGSGEFYRILDRSDSYEEQLVRKYGALYSALQKIFKTMEAYNKLPSTQPKITLEDVAKLEEYFLQMRAELSTRIGMASTIDAQKLMEAFPTRKALDIYIQNPNLFNQSDPEDQELIKFYAEMLADPVVFKKSYEEMAAVAIDTFTHKLSPRIMPLLHHLWRSKAHSLPIKESCYQLSYDSVVNVLIEKQKMIYPHELMCILSALVSVGISFNWIQELLEKCSAYIWADLITQLAKADAPLTNITVYYTSTGDIDAEQTLNEIRVKYGLFLSDYMSYNGVPKSLVAHQLQTTEQDLDQLDAVLSSIFGASKQRLTTELVQAYSSATVYQQIIDGKQRPVDVAAAAYAPSPQQQRPLSQGTYTPSLLYSTTLTAVWNEPSGLQKNLGPLKDFNLLCAIDKVLWNLSSRQSPLDIAKIWLVHNSGFAQAFDVATTMLGNRQGNLRFADTSMNFDPDCKQSYQKIKDNFVPHNMTSVKSKAPFIFGCHAVKSFTAAQEIAKTGFSADGTTGARFGAGVYFAAYYEYVKERYGAWTTATTPDSFHRLSKYIFIVAAPVHLAECLSSRQAKPSSLSLDSRYDLRVIKVDGPDLEFVGSSLRVLPIAVVEVLNDDIPHQRYAPQRSQSLTLKHRYSDSFLSSLKMASSDHERAQNDAKRWATIVEQQQKRQLERESQASRQEPTSKYAQRIVTIARVMRRRAAISEITAYNIFTKVTDFQVRIYDDGKSFLAILYNNFEEARKASECVRSFLENVVDGVEAADISLSQVANFDHGKDIIPGFGLSKKCIELLLKEIPQLTFPQGSLPLLRHLGVTLPSNYASVSSAHVAQSVFGNNDGASSAQAAAAAAASADFFM